MIFTPNQQVPCLEDDDMAAYAVYMQCLAEQVEASLVETTNSFNSFLNRPVALWTSGANQGIPLNTVTTLIVNPIAASSNWPSTVPFTPALPNVRGWYYIGAQVNMVATNPVADSIRQLQLLATISFGFTGDPIIGNFVETAYETNTGNGENLLVGGTVYFPGITGTGDNPVAVRAQVFHSNNVGTVNTTTTPPVAVWVVYLGDTPEIVSP